MNCVICGKPIKGHGNNAMPVKEGRCCDGCNYKLVLPSRFREGKKAKAR